MLCDAKSVDQVASIAEEYARLAGAGREDLGPVLFTRADPARAEAVLAALPGAFHDADARLLAWPAEAPEPTGGLVIVACAGTSDLPVAREAELTARYLGRPTRLIADVGIAGLHRLLTRLPELREAACVVVAAGMDGALPTVVAGQISAPVVALPTSVGYGVAEGGRRCGADHALGLRPRHRRGQHRQRLRRRPSRRPDRPLGPRGRPVVARVSTMHALQVTWIAR